MAELFLGATVDPATHERTGDDVRIGTDTFTTHGVIALAKEITTTSIALERTDVRVTKLVLAWVPLR